MAISYLQNYGLLHVCSYAGSHLSPLPKLLKRSLLEELEKKRKIFKQIDRGIIFFSFPSRISSVCTTPKIMFRSHVKLLQFRVHRYAAG